MRVTGGDLSGSATAQFYLGNVQVSGGNLSGTVASVEGAIGKVSVQDTGVGGD